MSTKRKYVEEVDDNDMHISNKKHTLDSDEEDSDEYEKGDLHDSDVEGEEDGISNVQDEVKITPFNMREELEEGHFDTEGQYHWNKGEQIKDNWLDNIDWVKVKTDSNYLKEENSEDSNESQLLPNAFKEIKLYTELLTFMQTHETINDTLQRLGKGRKKLSSVERIKQKKLGIIDETAVKITKIAELANDILTKTGNMDIYEMSYEQIEAKINSMPGSSKSASNNFDMYADDFNEKEKEKLDENGKNESTETKELLWEFKWKQTDIDLQGPYNTKQMLKWSQDGHFKTGVYCRKVGEASNFYTSNRIDFDLYL